MSIEPRNARDMSTAPILDQGRWKVPIPLDASSVVYRDATDEEMAKAQADAEAHAAVLAAARPKAKKAAKTADGPSVDTATGETF